MAREKHPVEFIKEAAMTSALSAVLAIRYVSCDFNAPVAKAMLHEGFQQAAED